MKIICCLYHPEVASHSDQMIQSYKFEMVILSVPVLVPPNPSVHSVFVYTN